MNTEKSEKYGLSYIKALMAMLSHRAKEQNKSKSLKILDDLENKELDKYLQYIDIYEKYNVNPLEVDMILGNSVQVKDLENFDSDELIRTYSALDLILLSSLESSLIFNALLSRGFDCSSVINTFLTAIEKGHKQQVEFLIEYGFDPNRVIDSNNSSVIDFALSKLLIRKSNGEMANDSAIEAISNIKDEIDLERLIISTAIISTISKTMEEVELPTSDNTIDRAVHLYELL